MAYKVLDSDGTPVRVRDGSDLFGSDTIGVVKAVDHGKRLLHITGSTENKDRDGDIIRVAGWDLSHYVKNPVFLWAHNYASVPLGAAVRVSKKRAPSPRLDFTIRFPSKPGLNEFADMILNLYGEKIINASSVGFIPQKWRELEEEKEGDEGGRSLLRMPGREYLKQELLELSGCAVPSNREALQNAIKSFGGLSTRQKDWALQMMVHGEEPKLMDDIREEIFQLGKEIQVEEDRDDGKTYVVFGGDVEVRNEKEKKEAQEGICKVEDETEQEEGRKEEPSEEVPDHESLLELFRVVQALGGIKFLKEVHEEIISAQKRVGGRRDLPLAPKDHPWDVRAADKRIRKWASADGSGDKEKMDWRKYRSVFAWFDPDNTDNFGGYKLLIADVVGGTAKAVWGAVAAAMAALNGARNGVNLPDSDRKPVYDFLAHYYKRFDQDPPALRSFYELAQEMGKLVEEAREEGGKQMKVISLEDAVKLLEWKEKKVKTEQHWSAVFSEKEDATGSPGGVSSGKKRTTSQSQRSVAPPRSTVEPFILGLDEKAIKELTQAVRQIKEQLKSLSFKR